MSGIKKAYSYLLWCIYTVVAAACTLRMGRVIGADLKLPSHYGLAGAAALIVLAGGVAFLLRALSPALTTYFERRKGVQLAIETALAVVLLTVGFVFRVMNLSEMGDAAAYYEAAEIRMGQGISPIAHGAVYLYVWLLHVVFIFLGNRLLAGILCQMVLQGIASILLMLLVRKYIGPVAALIFFGFLALSPYMVHESLLLSPRMLYLCLFSVAMSAVVTGLDKKPTPFMFAVAGIVSSLLSYLDLAGVLALLLSLCMTARLGGVKQGRLARKAELGMCCALGFAAGFLCCVLVDCLISGRASVEVLGSWIELYLPGTFVLPAFVKTGGASAEGLVLLGVLAAGIFSFWFGSERAYFSGAMTGICGVTVAMAYGMFTEEMPGMLCLYLLLVLLAGIGLEQSVKRKSVAAAQTKQTEAAHLIVEEASVDQADAGQEHIEGRAEVKREKAETKRKAAEEKAETKKKAAEEKAEAKRKAAEEKAEAKRMAAEEKSKAKRKTPERELEALQRDAEKSEIARDAAIDKLDAATETNEKKETTAEKQEKKEIKYLENPLPLPKKHEKKILDYDYPVADDDDFDI